MENNIENILNLNSKQSFFMDRLCQALYWFNHKYQIHKGEFKKVPRCFNPKIGAGRRDPDRYSYENYGHTPFSKREDKKKYLDGFVETYLFRTIFSKGYLDDVIFTKENYNNGQIITIFYGKKKLYKRILIPDIKKFFKLLGYNPKDPFGTYYFNNFLELYSLLEDASNIPILDEDINYLIISSKYIMKTSSNFSRYNIKAIA